MFWTDPIGLAKCSQSYQSTLYYLLSIVYCLLSTVYCLLSTAPLRPFPWCWLWRIFIMIIISWCWWEPLQNVLISNYLGRSGINTFILLVPDTKHPVSALGSRCNLSSSVSVFCPRSKSVNCAEWKHWKYQAIQRWGHNSKRMFCKYHSPCPLYTLAGYLLSDWDAVTL